MAKETNGSTVTETAPKKAGTKDDLRKAFAAYDAAEAEVTKAQAMLEKARAARSASVKRCVEVAGNKGPFKLQSGIVIKAVTRVNKETGAENWFFRGPSENDVTEI